MTEDEEVVARGDALYEGVVKAQVEPQFDGKYVAIHVDTGDYEVARSTGDAMRGLLKRHATDGRVYARKIGDEPEYGLAARLLAGAMGERKGR